MDTLLAGLPYRLVRYRGKPITEAIRDEIRDETYPMQLCTCRIDTDDLVASGYFARMRSAKLSSQAAAEGAVISFPGGCIYNAAEGAFYFSSYPANPFLGYLETLQSPEEFKGVYQAMHVDMLEVVPHVVALRGERPFWASVVHEHNLENDSLVALQAVQMSPVKDLKRLFGISETVL